MRTNKQRFAEWIEKRSGLMDISPATDYVRELEMELQKLESSVWGEGAYGGIFCSLCGGESQHRPHCTLAKYVVR